MITTKYHSRAPPTWECHRRGCTETNHHISPLTKATSEVLHHQPPASAAQSHHRSWRGKRPRPPMAKNPQPNGWTAGTMSGGSLKIIEKGAAKKEHQSARSKNLTTDVNNLSVFKSGACWKAHLFTIKVKHVLWILKRGGWGVARRPKKFKRWSFGTCWLSHCWHSPSCPEVAKKMVFESTQTNHFISFLFLWEQVNLLQSAPNDWEPNAPKTTHNWVRQKNACPTHPSQTHRSNFWGESFTYRYLACNI